MELSESLHFKSEPMLKVPTYKKGYAKSLDRIEKLILKEVTCHWDKGAKVLQ